jgi:D-3-phosphoglycerate dehydrogenase
VSRVVVTDHAFSDVEQERAMAAAAGAEFACHQATSEEEAVEAVRGADVALVNFAPVTEKVLSAMSPGATVIRYGIGYDNVDVEAARLVGVAVANIPDYGSDTVADHAASMILTLLRRLPHYDRSIRADGWCPPASVGPLPSFHAATVGLVGVGRIAQLLAARLAGFGFKLVGYDPLLPPEAAQAAGVRLMSLDEVASQAHALTLHVPATPETHHLVDAALISRMRDGAVLVNTSRGPLVNEHDLAAALTEGKLAGAALDVFDPEPLAADSPLRACPTALFTPHAAFYSTESLQNLQRLASEEAARALRGEPLRCPVT